MSRRGLIVNSIPHGMEGISSFIKENLNDPDSLQHIETRYWKKFDKNGQFNNTITVKTKYRAKNSFGGYVVEYISADCDMDGNIIKINSPTD